MGYIYETHMHTSEGSACGRSTGAEMARSYKEKGYTGIFVTDHFFNGHCAVDRSLNWEDKVALFCRGYENAKEEGERIGLQVFFGFEYTVNAADFLVYNLDKEWLLAHPDIDKMEVKQAFRLMHEGGGFIVHAHPFRERHWIHHIELFPRDVDAVEVYNGSQKNDEYMNERGEQYAVMYDLPQTAGSDSHGVTDEFLCAIETEVKIEKPIEYLEMIKMGSLKIRETVHCK